MAKSTAHGVQAIFDGSLGREVDGDNDSIPCSKSGCSDISITDITSQNGAPDGLQ